MEQQVMELINELMKDDQMYKTIIIAIASIAIIIFIAGITKNVVIFYDTKDLFIAIFSTLSLFIGYGLIEFYDVDGQVGYNSIQVAIRYLAIAISAICILLSFKNAIQYNKSFFIGLIIGIFKVLISTLSVVFIVGKIVQGIESHGGNKKGAKGIATYIGFIAILFYSLVNGRAVYNKKDWQLPENKFEFEEL